MTPLPYDRSVERALIARITADTGLDGLTAREMVEDVRLWGADSPFADEVGQAAQVILQPFLDLFAEVARLLADWYAEVGRVLAPVLREWSAVLDALGRQ